MLLHTDNPSVYKKTFIKRKQLPNSSDMAGPMWKSNFDFRLLGSYSETKGELFRKVCVLLHLL